MLAAREQLPPARVIGVPCGGHILRGDFFDFVPMCAVVGVVWLPWLWHTVGAGLERATSSVKLVSTVRSRPI